jgi:hypothetical protein
METAKNRCHNENTIGTFGQPAALWRRIENRPLFVQTGSGRPTLVARFQEIPFLATGRRQGVERRLFVKPFADRERINQERHVPARAADDRVRGGANASAVHAVRPISDTGVDP